MYLIYIILSYMVLIDIYNKLQQMAFSLYLIFQLMCNLYQCAKTELANKKLHKYFNIKLTNDDTRWWWDKTSIDCDQPPETKHRDAIICVLAGKQIKQKSLILMNFVSLAGAKRVQNKNDAKLRCDLLITTKKKWEKNVLIRDWLLYCHLLK